MVYNGDRHRYSFKLYHFELIKPSPSSEAPSPRSGHRMVCNSKHLYVFGGYNPTSTREMDKKELWKFNFVTRSWSRYDLDKRCPVGVVSPALIRRGQKLLVYGGTGVPFGLQSSNELHSIKLNKIDKGFTLVRIRGKQPEPQYGQAVFINKNSLYTVGGTTGLEYSCNIHRTNLSNFPRKWKSLYIKKRTEDNEVANDEPKGRYRHEVGFDGRNIYVLGGGTAVNTFDLKIIPTFNIESRSWKSMNSIGDPNSEPEYPGPRKCYGAVQVKVDKEVYVYVVAGSLRNDHVYNDLWQLQLSTLQWTHIRDNIFPKALFFHDVSLNKRGKMFVFGGIEEGARLRRSNNLFTAWICIPKLSEIAWEAFVHYFPRALVKERLINLNVPNEFVSRLE